MLLNQQVETGIIFSQTSLLEFMRPWYMRQFDINTNIRVELTVLIIWYQRH